MKTASSHEFLPIMRLLDQARGAALGDLQSRYQINDHTLARPDRDSSGGAAWSHAYGPELERIRHQCRAIVRNDSVARAMVKMHQALVVGDGAVVRSTTMDPAWNESCDRLFSLWCDGHGGDDGLGHPDVEGRRTLWQLCHAIVRAWDVDGDVLVVKLGGPEAGDDAGRLQLIEADRVCSPMAVWAMRASAGAVKVATSATGTTTVDGVERTLRGRPVRYHVSNWSGLGSYTGGTAIKIDAADAWLMVNPSDDDVGMVRGEPGLQATVPRLERLNKYSERHAVLALVATLFGLVISGPASQSLNASLQETDEDQPDSGPGTMKLDTAAVIATEAGSTVTQVKPESPNTSFKEYVTFEVMLACADMGLPVCFVLFDATQISYIAARAMGAIAMRRLGLQQAQIASFVRNVRAWKVREWIADGRLKNNPQWSSCEVTLQQAPVFDPGSEVQATLDAIAGRVMTYEQAIQMLGNGKAGEVHAQLEREIGNLRDKGIEPSDKPGAKPASAFVSPSPSSGP
jgi:capsid protein